MHSINSRNENLFNIVVSSTSLKEEVILSKTKNVTSKSSEEASARISRYSEFNSEHPLALTMLIRGLFSSTLK